MHFNNLRIGTRLGIGFGTVLLLTVFIGATGAVRLQQMDRSAGVLGEKMVGRLQLTNDWLHATSNNSIRALAVVKSDDPETQRFFQQQMDTHSKKISELQKQLEAGVDSATEKQLFAEVAARRSAYIEKRKGVLKAREGGDAVQAKNLIDREMMPTLDAYVTAIQNVLGFYKDQVKAAESEIDGELRSGLLALLIAVGFAITFGSLCSIYLTRGITRPLGEALAVARTVASGDLTSRIEARSRDETGQLLQALSDMNDSLVKIVGQVRGGTEEIASASRQIASGNADLSSRTEEQASSLEKTASSMEELTSTVKQNADNARQANLLAVAASDVAAKGGGVVSEVVETMGSINDSSRKIVDIIAVIDGIAFQTNILALNAAVEAARAGEQGRGFAVVALEVRSLAQRSAAAAKEIKSLIDDSVRKVDAGSRLVDQAGSTMQEVVESIRRVTDLMAQISAASQEQTAGIELVNQAVAQMDQATQQNASLVEESAAASEAMREQAESLSRMVSAFKLDALPAMVPGSARRQVVDVVPVTKKNGTPDDPSQVKRLATSGTNGGTHWEEF